MMRMTKHDAEWLKRAMLRITLEAVLMILLLIFHGTWTWLLVIALIGCFLWGSVETHYND